MPYQVPPVDPRKRQAPQQTIAAAPAPVAAPQAPVVGPTKTPLRQFGDAAYDTARGIAGAVGSVTVGPAVDIGRGALALATGNDPRNRPGGAFSTTTAYNAQAKDAERAVFGGTGQAIQQAGSAITGAKPFESNPAAQGKTAVVPAGTLASLKNPANQTIAQPAGGASDLLNNPGAGFVRSVSGPSFADNTRGFVAGRQREREANLAKRDAQIDASIANSIRTKTRNDLQSELNRTPQGGGIQRQGEYRPRGGSTRRQDLQAQIAGLAAPVQAIATPTAGDVQKGGAELAAAENKNAADKIQLEGLARKNKLIQQIAQLDPNSPEAGNLRATIAVMDGKDPNAERFQGLEEIVGTDQFGTPIKVRSLFDTRTGSFIDRSGGAAQGQPKQDFVEGKVYTDASGNKAKFVNGQFKPL